VVRLSGGRLALCLIVQQTSGERRHWYSPAPDPELPPISAKRAYTEVLFVFGAFFASGIVLAGLILGGRSSDITTDASWGLYSAQAVQLLFEIALAVVVVWLLSERRGVSLRTLGVVWPTDDDGNFSPGRTVRNLAWATLALGIGLPLTALLHTSSLPKNQANAPAMALAVFVGLNAGVVEELVVLGFVVVTLRQARRPWWEVTLVALALRGSYHIYYGVGVIGILIWASLFYWIYLRTRSLLPLMVTHAAWDTSALLSQRWPWAISFVFLGGGALLIAAPITWLIERNNHPPVGWQPGFAGPPAGSWPASLPSGPGPGGPAWPAGAGSGGPSPAPAPPQPQPHAGPVPAAGVAPMSTAPGPMSPFPGPGWHPDPSGLNQWRWWDGQRWTGYVSGHASGP
jgi:membrane protease YdiL (CAAX protease family)